MKKLFGILFLTCLFSCLLAMAAFADTEGDWEYTVLTGGKAEITSYTGSDVAVVIPSKLGGHTVTSLGEGCFANCSNSGITI